MNKLFLILSFLLLATSIGHCQKKKFVKFQKVFKTDKGSSVFLPLGRISFADSVVSNKIGYPRPYKKFCNSKEALNEPNYTRYEDAQFLSLGCGGNLVVVFTNNGFMNLKGDDLYIFEVGPSKEAANIEVSKDGKEWLYAGKIVGGKSSIDLSDENIDTETVFYYVRVTDLKSLCNSKSAGADIDAIAAINCVIKLTINADVLFDSAKFDIKESAENNLKALSKQIMQVDEATLLIEGFTDDDGEEEMNLELSKNRCNAVLEKLVKLLKDKNKYDFEINAYGESKPRVPNDTEENKQLNRRVEITVLPPKSYFEGMK